MIFRNRLPKFKIFRTIQSQVGVISCHESSNIDKIWLFPSSNIETFFWLNSKRVGYTFFVENTS